MFRNTRPALAGLLLACLPAQAQASEKDELARVMRQLDLVQAAFSRAQALHGQSEDDGRFYFDYARAGQDIQAMKRGISEYLEPSRAQPREPATVDGRYRRESAR